jgi:hypothetical protein
VRCSTNSGHDTVINVAITGIVNDSYSDEFEINEEPVGFSIRKTKFLLFNCNQRGKRMKHGMMQRILYIELE